MICPGCGHSSHTPFACAAQDSCLCATCPGEAQHGNPFRYCPVKGCAWMEERPTGPACTSQATAILGAPDGGVLLTCGRVEGHDGYHIFHMDGPPAEVAPFTGFPSGGFTQEEQF